MMFMMLVLRQNEPERDLYRLWPESTVELYKRDYTFLNRAASAAEAHFVDQRTSAAGAAYQESAEKEAAGKEAASEGVGGSRRKCAAQTTDVAYGLRLSHSVDEDDVSVADKRRGGAHGPVHAHPATFQKLRADLPEEGDALVPYWHGIRSSFPQLYAVSLRILPVHPSQYHSERKFPGAGKTMSGKKDAEWGAQLPLVGAGGE
jgi:hypothetical protein